jgi:hypothetical protein
MANTNDDFFTRDEDLHFRRTVWLLSVLAKATHRKTVTGPPQPLLSEMLCLANLFVREHEVVATMAVRSGEELLIQARTECECVGLEGHCVVARNFRRLAISHLFCM